METIMNYVNIMADNDLETLQSRGSDKVIVTFCVDISVELSSVCFFVIQYRIETDVQILNALCCELALWISTFVLFDSITDIFTDIMWYKCKPWEIETRYTQKTRINNMSGDASAFTVATCHQPCHLPFVKTRYLTGQ